MKITRRQLKQYIKEEIKKVKLIEAYEDFSRADIDQQRLKPRPPAGVSAEQALANLKQAVGPKYTREEAIERLRVWARMHPNLQVQEMAAAILTKFAPDEVVFADDIEEAQIASKLKQMKMSYK